MNHIYNVSEKAAEILDEFANSGSSETAGVAEILGTIAENGSGSETDEYMIACAGEIRSAAAAFISRLGNVDPWADPTGEIKDWRREVANGDTVLGFQDWKDHKRETERDERGEE